MLILYFYIFIKKNYILNSLIWTCLCLKYKYDIFLICVQLSAKKHLNEISSKVKNFIILLAKKKRAHIMINNNIHLACMWLV